MEFKAVGPEGAELVLESTKVTVPAGALSRQTDITLSLADSRHLIPMLKASGWEKIVQLATAVHIECNPPLEHFDRPISIVTSLPEEGEKSMSDRNSSMIRLMHSNYLRHWEDITDDVFSRVGVEGDEVRMETNLTGWVAISVIQFNASMIAQMVLKSISIEPVMVRLSAYGFMDAERRSVQVAVFAMPCNSSEEPIHKELSKPENFVPISFPHVVQAYPNERLRMEIQGQFEPDASLGEESLVFEMEMTQKHNQILSKWVRSTASPDAPFSGKLRVSSCRSSSGKWETVASIGLSMRSGCGGSSSNSSASDHN